MKLEPFVYIAAVGTIAFVATVAPSAAPVIAIAVTIGSGLILSVINYERGQRDAYTIADFYIKEAEQAMNKAHALRDAAQQMMEATRKLAAKGE